MSEYAKYCVKTALLGFLGAPLMLGIASILVGIVSAELLGSMDALVRTALVCVAVVAATQLPLWFGWSRIRQRPDSWFRALLPVALPPAVMVLGWSITYLVGGERAVAEEPFAVAPHFLLLATALLTGTQWLVPTMLVLTLMASVGGYVWGRSRIARPPSGKAGLVGVLVGTLVLAAIPTAQTGYAVWLQNVPTVGDEVDLWEYAPWQPGNRLAVPASPPSLRIEDGFPKLDGATALYPLYAAVAQAGYVRPSPPTDEKDEAFLAVACSRTAEAYDRLVAGEVDAIFVAQPSRGHLDKAKAAGVELQLTPIGREAFTFFVNSGNPVTGLSSGQLRDIYSGGITNWNQLGGPNERITAYQRPEDSGSQTVMLAKVMGSTPMLPPMRETEVSGMGGVIEQVAAYRNVSSAIGYTFRWYATVMNANPDIRLLAVDGVEPTTENIRNGSYPFTVDFYAVTAGSTNPNTQKLIDWLRSAEGQAFVEQIGYVGL